jgi:hypothetical protein
MPGGAYLSNTATAGTAQSVTNSQCTVLGGPSSVSISGGTLTAKFFIAFAPGFSGNKQLYAVAEDQAGNFSASSTIQLATYDVTASVTPGTVSTPPAGWGGTFTSTFTDSTSTIKEALVSFHSVANSSSSTNQCGLRYDLATSNIFLINDAGTSFGQPITAGSAATLSNSQCVVQGSLSSATTSNGTTTVNFFVSFTPPYAGTLQIQLGGEDVAGNFTSTEQSYGTYSVGTSLTPVSVSPSSGSGTSGTGRVFTATYTDTVTSIQQATLLLGTGSATQSICGVRYDPGTQQLHLINDAGTAYMPTTTIIGSGASLGNSQCTVIATGSSASQSGNTLTVNFDISFTPAFAGVRQITMGGEDGNGNFSISEKSFGSYTITVTPPEGALTALTGGPSCVASANGTNHVICVMNGSGNELIASVQTEPAAVGPPDSTSLNLGVSGLIGNSSCTSTADASGDVICAYNNAGTLYGIRFNLLAASPVVYGNGMQQLVSSVSGIASCALGSPRFTTFTTANPAGSATDDAVCAINTTNNGLTGVAYYPSAPSGAGNTVNPAVQILKNNAASPASEIFPTSNPSCNNPNSAPQATGTTNQIICAFNTSNGLEGIAFDPRAGYLSSIQQLYTGTNFTNDPGCSTPLDPSSQIICAMWNSTLLEGFAFDPRTPYASALMPLGPAVATATGNPSCSGFQDMVGNDGVPPVAIVHPTVPTMRQVICGFRATLGNASTTIGTNTVADSVFSIEFDPRTGYNGNFQNIGQTATNDLSCSFQNVTGGHVTCGAIIPNDDEFIVMPFVSTSLAIVPIPIQTSPGSFTVSATSLSSGAITYSIVSGPATISGSTVTLNDSGKVVWRLVRRPQEASREP